MDEKRASAPMGIFKGITNRASNESEQDPEPPYTPSEKQQPQQEIAPPPAFRTNFASISLHMKDRIRFIRFPLHQIVEIREVIQQSWPKGIQDVRAYDESQEVKLRGCPWQYRWNDDKMNSRMLMCALFNRLYNMGWVLKVAVDISKKEFDKDTLIFRQQTPPPPPCSWISMSFDRADLMHVFNAPPELNQSFLDAIGLRVQRSQYLQPKVFEIKFRGYPWTASGTDTVQQRVFMLNFMECLEQHGFTLYTSMTQDDGPGGDNHSSGADTWYCNRPQDWSPGVPIYH